MMAELAFPRPSRSFLLAALAGAAGGLLFWSYYRVFTAKFPLVFVNPEVMVIALSGLASGLLSARLRPRAGWPLDLLAAAGLAAFALGNLSYKDQSIHFLFFSLYYAFPAPTNATRVMAGHVIALIASPVPYFILGRYYAGRLSGSRLSAAGAALGAAAGLVAAYAAVPSIGGYAALFIACILVSAFIGRRAVAASSAAVMLLGGVLLAHPKEAFFTWQLRHYERLKSFWSDYYKIDYLSFDEDRCMTAVHNMIAVWSTCPEPERQLLIYKRLSAALAGGPIPKARVLTLGRADGSFARSMRLNNPALKRLLTVEYDRRISADMGGPYAKYNGEIYRQHGIEAAGEDIRFFIENTEEKFDVVYLNGPGIMLFFYPLTLITQEDYIFSAESYARIFDGILSQDGVLLMDRGTNFTDEAYMWGGSLPGDVHMRVLWTKIADFPFTGVPLGYVIASRNEAELDRIVDELVVGNVFTEVPYDPAKRASYGHTDDRPFMQPQGMVLFLAPTLPMFILIAALVRRHRGRLRRAVGDYRVLGLGALSAMIWLWTVTRGARPFAKGAPLGFTLTSAAFLAGAAAMLLAHGSSSRRPRLRLALSWALCSAGLLLPIMVPFRAETAVVACLLGGSGVAGMCSGFAIRRRDGAPGTSLIWLGALLGIMLFQWMLFGLGFAVLAAVLSAAALCLAALDLRSRTF